jgi:hypothetical protein
VNERIDFAGLREFLALGGEGGYRRIEREHAEALLEVAELAKHYTEPLPYRRELEEAKRRGDKLRAALARFDFGGGS